MPRKRFVFILEYCSLLPLMWCLRLLPAAVSNRCADGLAWFAFTVLKLRRNVAERNLQRAFPDKDAGWVRATAYGSYRTMARVFIEFARFPVLRHRLRNMVTLEPAGIFDRLRERGKGVIMVSAHFGSWEVLAAAFPAYGHPLTALARNQKNGFVDNVIHGLRTGMGVSIIHTNKSMRGVLRALADNQVLFILSDQSAGKRGVWIDFLGRPASAFQGAAQFHLKTGSPLIVCMNVRNPDNTYTIYTEELAVDLTGNRNRDISAITQAYSDVICRYIRKYPEQWWWMHRRWNSTRGIGPEGTLLTKEEYMAGRHT